jgi:hypothetical protein
MNNITHLPLDWSTLASLDARLASGNLSFEELEVISGKLKPLLKSTCDKVYALAKKIFHTIVELKEQLLHRDLGLVAELQTIEGAVEKLWLQQQALTPEELAEEIVALEKQLIQLKVPFSPRLRAKHKALEQELEKLQFAFVFPVVSELEEVENTFASELKKIAEQVENGGSLDELTETQKKEVYRSVPQGASPEGLAHAFETYLSSLRVQAALAQHFFAGRIEEGFSAQLDLPEDVRMRIDDLIWEAAGQAPIDPTIPENQQLMAGAVLQGLEERMGYSDIL